MSTDFTVHAGDASIRTYKRAEGNPPTFHLETDETRVVIFLSRDPSEALAQADAIKRAVQTAWAEAFDDKATS